MVVDLPQAKPSISDWRFTHSTEPSDLPAPGELAICTLIPASTSPRSSSNICFNNIYFSCVTRLSKPSGCIPSIFVEGNPLDAQPESAARRDIRPPLLFDH